MTLYPLDKEDSIIYRGVAILVIAAHNFLQSFPQPRFNQFFFDAENVLTFGDMIWVDPLNGIRYVFAFLGHFGVQIFIFLSAYGLTKRYMTEKPVYWNFIRSRFKRIYPMFIMSVAVWAIYMGFLNVGILGPLKVIYWNWNDLLLKLTLISNFILGRALPPVGAWWFIPFIFQFYAVFPLLLWMSHRWKWVPLFLVSVASIGLTLLLYADSGEFNLHATVLPRLPEFCLGIYVASRDAKGLRIPSILVLLAAVVFLLGNFFQVFWFLHHISALVVLLAICRLTMPTMKRFAICKVSMFFVGSISFALFLVNGFTRYPFAHLAREYDHWALTIMLCAVSLATAISIAYILTQVESRILGRFRRDTRRQIA